jgi:hypothetical protein
MVLLVSNVALEILPHPGSLFSKPDRGSSRPEPGKVLRESGVTIASTQPTFPSHPFISLPSLFMVLLVSNVALEILPHPGSLFSKPDRGSSRLPLALGKGQAPGKSKVLPVFGYRMSIYGYFST